MSWKLFLPFLLAALLTGNRVSAPRLSPPIPPRADPACDYPRALDDYLLAYAYSRELPDVAGKFLSAAERGLATCSGDHGMLSARAARLRASLP